MWTSVCRRLTGVVLTLTASILKDLISVNADRASAAAASTAQVRHDICDICAGHSLQMFPDDWHKFHDSFVRIFCIWHFSKNKESESKSRFLWMLRRNRQRLKSHLCKYLLLCADLWNKAHKNTAHPCVLNRLWAEMNLFLFMNTFLSLKIKYVCFFGVSEDSCYQSSVAF